MKSDIKSLGYFGPTLAAERPIADSGLPWTTLRAARFHDLLLMTVRQLAAGDTGPGQVQVPAESISAG
jgi:hypothetical protein